MAATRGFGESSSRRRIACVFADRASDSSRVVSASKILMSVPATKVVPAPVRTTVSTAGSPPARATASSIPSHTAVLRALTGGLSIVTTATRSMTS
jgi:hypothetical protein